jgi:hypothetical protein
LIVSGLRTSPKDLSRIESGEAILMVILENDDLGRLSFLIAIMRYLFYNVLTPLVISAPISRFVKN